MTCLFLYLETWDRDVGIIWGIFLHHPLSLLPPPPTSKKHLSGETNKHRPSNIICFLKNKFLLQFKTIVWFSLTKRKIGFVFGFGGIAGGSSDYNPGRCQSAQWQIFPKSLGGPTPRISLSAELIHGFPHHRNRKRKVNAANVEHIWFVPTFIMK